MVERTPIGMDDIIKDIIIPDLGCALIDLKEKKVEQEDLFAEKQRKSWDKSMEARCDFQRKIRLTRRGGVFFFSIWQKSLMGRTLTEIKGDDKMIDFFAEEVGAFAKEIIGHNLDKGDWCIITTPKRRHLVRNFATCIAMQMAQMMRIPFYLYVCSCRTKQRVNAIFDVDVIPKENNIIVFDDFVTTGSTLGAMYRAFEPYSKNLVFFVGINNKL